MFAFLLLKECFGSLGQYPVSETKGFPPVVLWILELYAISSAGRGVF